MSQTRYRNIWVRKGIRLHRSFLNLFSAPAPQLACVIPPDSHDDNRTGAFFCKRFMSQTGAWQMKLDLPIWNIDVAGYNKTSEEAPQHRIIPQGFAALFTVEV